MKKLIIAFFLLSFFLFNIKFLAGEESYVRIEPIKEVKKNQRKSKEIIKTVKKASYYKKKKYIPPTGKALEIAQKVATETNYSVDTISRIMFAESEYDSKAIHLNKNKTTDHGLFQINSSHISLAKKKGMDIFTDEGNAQFAIYLMKKNGLHDWSASLQNWQN